MLTVVTPAYNEENNLADLYPRLKEVLEGMGVEWEWLIIDDHSSDNTFEVISKLAEEDPRVRGMRLSRNSGSHNGLLCGLTHAKGDAVIGMSADGQDPPKLISKLFAQWEKGSQVVWAARKPEKNDQTSNRFFGRLYYFLMRNIVGIKNLPKHGADYFLIDRQVCNAVLDCKENNISILMLITWMGFRQTTVEYKREARIHGQSKWTLSKKIKLVVDSVVGFSNIPIRLLGALGGLFALSGLLYVPVVIANALLGEPTEGWSALMVIILVLGGFQMLMVAVLGEYLWRTLDAARQRPNFMIENVTSPQAKKGRR